LYLNTGDTSLKRRRRRRRRLKEKMMCCGNGSVRPSSLVVA